MFFLAEKQVLKQTFFYLYIMYCRFVFFIKKLYL